MQVVYSGGSNTPTPSPRLQRKTGYGRPVMPGYMTHVQPQVLVQRSREKLTEGDTTLRDSIPAMSTCVASLCLVLNIFIPGSGTLTAGLSVLCCSKVRPRDGTKRHCILLNAGVALMQFLLTFLFLLGWIWSITWGIAFITISRKYQRGDLTECHDQHTDEDHIHGHKNRNAHSKPSHSPCGSPGKRNRVIQQEHIHHHDHHHDHHHHQHQHHSPHQHHHSHTKHPNSHRHQQQQHHQHSPHTQRGDATPSSRASNSPQPSFKLDASGDSSPEVNHQRVNPSPNNNNLSIATSNNRQTRHHTRYNNNNNPVVSHDRQYADLPQPIIVLQKAPGASEGNGLEEGVSTAPESAIMQARTRHMKILQRKMSDNDLSPFVLTNQQLQAIVIHDLPIVGPINPRQSQNTIDEEPNLALPKP